MWLDKCNIALVRLVMLHLLKIIFALACTLAQVRRIGKACSLAHFFFLCVCVCHLLSMTDIGIILSVHLCMAVLVTLFVSAQ